MVPSIDVRVRSFTNEMLFQAFLVLCLAVVRIDAQQDCTGHDDGIYGAGCHSYTECTGGVGITKDCPLPDLAYDEEFGGCDDIEDVPPPCGNNRNCVRLNGQPVADGKYPDPTVGQFCESYFTCTGGVYFGTNPCNAPDAPKDLVFDRALQVCNWRNQVPPPCGTYSP
jgi:hypothetical protein